VRARLRARAVRACALLSSAALGSAALTASASAAPVFLHVGAAGGPQSLAQIVDPAGREVLLKGVNVDGLVDYFQEGLTPPYPSAPTAYAKGACPADDPNVEGVDVCKYDFAQLRALGYDAIRLNVSWSLLEPSPGVISQSYLKRIAQVVGWAKAAGIYVIIDMHQDAWSKYVYTEAGQTCPPGTQAIRGFDGAPLWASAHLTPACATNGVRELDPAVQEDFQKLYDDAPAPDGVGLQEHYAAALLALAERFHENPAVAGYEIINEPSPGFNAVPGEVDATELFPFYAKVVDDVIAKVAGFKQLFFIEPNVERDVTDHSAIVTPWSAYSSYANVVYAPHIYTGTFTLDQQATSTRFFPSEAGYESAESDAKALGLPLWIGEFGNNPENDNTLLKESYELQDRFALGGTLWLWKENANDVNRAVFWGVYGPPFPPGEAQPLRVYYTSRAYPVYTDGDIDSFAYDPASASFDLKAQSPPATPGVRSAATVIYVPRAVTKPITASGAVLRTMRHADGSRTAYAWPLGGAYEIRTG
jgi:endoglycosylceramidase